MRRKSIALLAIVAALSGCSVGPHYKAPGGDNLTTPF